MEHVESEQIFCDMLEDIQEGVRSGGIVCFVINSEVTEVDTVTGRSLSPQFEVNLSTKCLKECLEEIYRDWEVIKYAVNTQEYDIPRENMVHLTSNVVTWVARKA